MRSSYRQTLISPETANTMPSVTPTVTAIGTVEARIGIRSSKPFCPLRGARNQSAPADPTSSALPANNEPMIPPPFLQSLPLSITV